MVRIKRGFIARKRRKKILNRNRSFQASSKNSFRIAYQKYIKAKNSAYHDGKKRKRLFRNLWITRISSSTRVYGLSFNQFINFCKKSNIQLNRKIISQLFIHDSISFFEELNFPI
nr:ribosomal protein L20 [Ostreobium quekettii]